MRRCEFYYICVYPNASRNFVHFLVSSLIWGEEQLPHNPGTFYRKEKRVLTSTLHTGASSNSLLDAGAVVAVPLATFSDATESGRTGTWYKGKALVCCSGLG